MDPPSAVTPTGGAEAPVAAALPGAVATSEGTSHSTTVEGTGSGPRVGLVYNAVMLKHRNEFFPHPEQPARIERIHAELEAEGLLARCVPIPARAATKEELASVHISGFVDNVVDDFPTMTLQELKHRGKAYNSVYLNEHSSEAALVAAGSTVELTKQVVAGHVDRGVAIVRPPGHHAEPGACMGFCVFNNVAVAAKLAVTDWGLERVLIVDWDVHHGNGTQNMFIDDPRVLYFSVHRYDTGYFYPGPSGDPSIVGTGAGAGKNLNIGWDTDDETHMGDAEYLAAWNHILLPIAREYNPQLVLISAGFDAAKGDPLGGQSITPSGYAALTHALLELGGGKVVLVLEGGYNLTAISKSFAACTRVLLGDSPDLPGVSPLARDLPILPGAAKNLAATAEAHKPFWSSMAAFDVAGIPVLPPAPAAGLGEEESKSFAEETAVVAAGAAFSVDTIKDCPHVHGVAVPSEDVAKAALTDGCSVAGCTTSSNSLLCLAPGCHQRFCRRSENAHMLAHFEALGAAHAISMSPDDLSTWCFLCDGYLDQYEYPSLFVAYTALHVAKFGVEPAVPAHLQLELGR